MLLGLSSRGWMALALIPLLSLGGLETPALQALLSKTASSERQGELQGVMASLISFAGIVAPLGLAAIYGATSEIAPGLIWFVGAALSAACIPFAIAGRRTPARENRPSGASR
jgi:DHA1 family tetracycline resistance protein-like MFS transporter